MIKIKEFRDKQEFIRKEGCIRTTETAIESANKFLTDLHENDVIEIVFKKEKVIVVYRETSKSGKPVDSYMHGRKGVKYE